MQFLCILFFAFFCNVLLANEYKFSGKHFLASYMECDREAIENIEHLLEAMDFAVSQCGATVLAKTPYIFDSNGVTCVYTLSESHASIHTYPELQSCFVDLFTCGDRCSSEKFHEILSNYLKPKKIDSHLFIRNETTSEVMIPNES
jgi:S-adenosylmethionine decarboxylase